MYNDRKLGIPILKTLKSYQRSWLRPDIIAGVTVAAVALPQALAYAQLAGLPMQTGLYASLVAMLIFAALSSSRFVIVGPDAAMAALTGAAILPLTTAGAKATDLAALLCLFIGLACLVGVVARLDFVGEFLSRPILLGYMAGLALAVIAAQLPKLFGISIPSQDNFFLTLWYIITHLLDTHFLTLIFSILTILIFILLKKFRPSYPAALIVLVGSLIASLFLDFNSVGVQTIGNIPTGIPIPHLTVSSLSNMQNLIIPALAIAIVSYANTIANARSYAVKSGEQVTGNQELLGLGVANAGAGIFGGLPVAASGARTAVNYQSRAKTQLAQVFGAVCIGLTLLFVAPYLGNLPQAVLAVIIINAVWGLFDLKELKSIWHAWQSEAILAIITVLGVTLLGIFQGLLLVVLLAVFNLVRKSAFPDDAVLGVAEDGSVRDVRRPPKTTTIPGLITYRFDAPLYFANANYFRERVWQLINESEEPVHWFLWDAETITTIDSSGGQMLLSLVRELKKHEITFAIARMKGPIRHTISKSRRLNRAVLGTPRFTSIGKAINAFEEAQTLAKSKRSVARR